MIQNNRLLIVAGSGRNVGKTEFVSRLIQKISPSQAICALKVSAVVPNEEIYHGNHSSAVLENYLIEETQRNTNKDTSRMLRAGACRVFYLRSDDAGIEKGFEEFQKHVPEDAAIICESNSLWQYVNPGLLFVVRSTDGVIKPRAVPLLERADMIVVSDRLSGFPEIDRVGYNETDEWYLKQ